jgi:hypothetical protein
MPLAARKGAGIAPQKRQMGVQLLSKRHRQIVSLPEPGVLVPKHRRSQEGWNVHAILASPRPPIAASCRSAQKMLRIAEPSTTRFVSHPYGFFGRYRDFPGNIAQR